MYIMQQSACLVVNLITVYSFDYLFIIARQWVRLHSSIAIILMGKRELVALLNLSSCWLVMVEQLFLTVPWACLRFVIVVFPEHTHLLSRLNNDPDVKL